MTNDFLGQEQINLYKKLITVLLYFEFEKVLFFKGEMK